MTNVIPNDILARFASLTSRQQTVFMLIADGLTNGEIAIRLGLSVDTVKSHRAAALCKMEVTTRSGILALAQSIRANRQAGKILHTEKQPGRLPDAGFRTEEMIGILDARNQIELYNATERLVRGMGFDRFVMAIMPDPKREPNRSPVMLGSYPRAWLERYDHEHYELVDPAAQHCVNHFHPVAWSNSLFHATAARAAFYEEARSHGISAGGSCPLPRHDTQFAGFGFSRDQDADAASRDVLQALPGMFLLASFAYETWRRLAVSSLALPQEIPSHLTPRERECLQLASKGLNDQEIADRVRTTRRTVHYHIANAKQKLGATNRAQAIARALLGNLIPG